MRFHGMEEVESSNLSRSTKDPLPSIGDTEIWSASDMAAAHTFLTPAQFEQLYSDSVKPYFEFWYGEAIQKSMPTLTHSVMQWVIAMLFARRGWRSATELRLKISKVAYPVPDVAGNPGPFRSPYPKEPIDLCVEILSPGDNLIDTFKKAAHYLDWGIGSVWIVDPEKRNAHQMSIGNPRPIPVSITDSLTAGSGNSEISIPLSEIFTETDAQLGNHETR